ncbi:MAG: cell wall hydrolase [Clostridiaceae bacterium]|nr:cell wall hydrolase [Eubacteriales bacterium]
MAQGTKSFILLLAFAALLLGGCAAQTATGLSERAVSAAVRLEEGFVEITPLPDTPAPATPTPVTATPTLPPATPAATLAPTEAPTPSPTPDYELTDVKDVKGYVGAVSVNLRAGPGTEYDVIGEYECNTLLLITAKTVDWYRVEVDGKNGFMLKEFIGVGAIPTPTPEPTKKPSSSSRATAAPTEAPKATATPAPVEAKNDGAGGYSAEEVLLTAQIVYEESKRGDYDGYRAVANVILNRVKSGIFRSTVEGVIFQGNGSQFTPAKDEAALRAVKPSSLCIEAVQAVFGGDTILPSNAYYFRPSKKGESWSSHNYIATYGGNSYFS